jgi:hypothetical protein
VVTVTSYSALYAYFVCCFLRNMLDVQMGHAELEYLNDLQLRCIADALVQLSCKVRFAFLFFSF